MLALNITATLFLALQTATAAPPPTRAEPVVEKLHGVEIIDEYRWLEPLEAESEAVRQWTTAQNEYTRQVLDNLPGRAALEDRLAELMTVPSVSAPALRGNRYFYTRREGDQNQPVLYLRESVNGEDRTLINPNTLDERGLYALDWYVPSHDGTLLAFGLSYAGDEMTVLHVMDVDRSQWLADEITGKVEFAGWAPDNRSFLYGKLEEPSDAYSRSFRYHVLGRHWREDPLLFEQEIPSRIPDAMLSRDGRWIVTQMFEGWSKQDIYHVDADEWRRTGEFEQKPLAVGLDARFAPQFIVDDTLYLLTTLDAPNGMLYAVNLNRPEQEHWKVLIPQRDDAVLRGADEARDMIVASYQKDATSRFDRFSMEGELIGPVELPGPGTASISTHYDRTEAFLSFESFNEPESIYHLDLAESERSLWARPDVPVDPSKVVVKQEWTTSSDGTRVPVFVVHAKDVTLDGDNPTLLYGYGGFNVTLTPWFSATTFPWLENGGVFAVATLRGGGEYGEEWHRAGMLANKQNVFDDLYAAAEYLIDAGYTSSDHLAVMGGSNGGLLTGVAATQRPDLWAAVVSAVPLLDMLRYHNLLMAKFWVPEYGDPGNAEHFAWLHAYSPYHHIEEGQKYPAMLITAGENDNRVHPMHARKMTAALQKAAANDFEEDPILLWVDREAGHGRGKPLHLQIREAADRWSFLMWQTGMSGEL